MQEKQVMNEIERNWRFIAFFVLDSGSVLKSG